MASHIARLCHRGYCRVVAYPQLKDVNCVGNVLRKWQTVFEENCVSEPQESAGYIIAHVLGQKTVTTLDQSQTLTAEQRSTVDLMCEKRLKRIPVQYVIGEWDFRDLTLVVKPPVFIPRPETEELVTHVHSDMVSKGITMPHILEVGCGSGAICLSLLSLMPQATVTAIDQSEEAVNLTVENAVSHRLDNRVQVYHLNLTSDALSEECLQQEFDVIVSNPPYIPTNDMASLAKEIVDCEDHRALCGGSDGLDLIKVIIDLSTRILKTGGSLWLEVDPSHPPMIERYVKGHPTFKRLSYKKTVLDFRDLQRFCHLMCVT